MQKWFYCHLLPGACTGRGAEWRGVISFTFSTINNQNILLALHFQFKITRGAKMIASHPYSMVPPIYLENLFPFQGPFNLVRSALSRAHSIIPKQKKLNEKVSETALKNGNFHTQFMLKLISISLQSDPSNFVLQSPKLKNFVDFPRILFRYRKVHL